MKKILTILSSVICLLLVSQVYSNQYDGQYGYPRQSPSPYANQCVGRCDDPCVGECVNLWGGRFYAGAFGGANWLNFRRTDDIKLKMDVGYGAAVSLGYKFNNGFRLEGEVAYRRNHMKNKEGHAYNNDSYNNDSYNYESFKICGNTCSWSYMANFLYDFDQVSCYWPNIVPYVGFGVGYTHINAHVKAHGGNEHIHYKGKDNGVAGQAIAGVSYRLTNETSLGVEYRYFVGRERARDHSVGLALRQSF